MLFFINICKFSIILYPYIHIYYTFYGTPLVAKRTLPWNWMRVEMKMNEHHIEFEWDWILPQATCQNTFSFRKYTTYSTFLFAFFLFILALFFIARLKCAVRNVINTYNALLRNTRKTVSWIDVRHSKTTVIKLVQTHANVAISHQWVEGEQVNPLRHGPYVKMAAAD